jgi:hypothetical protein
MALQWFWKSVYDSFLSQTDAYSDLIIVLYLITIITSFFVTEEHWTTYSKLHLSYLLLGKIGTLILISTIPHIPWLNFWCHLLGYVSIWDLGRVLYNRMANYSKKKDKVCKKCKGEAKKKIEEDPNGFYLFDVLNGEILKESKEKEDGRAWGCNRRAD